MNLKVILLIVYIIQLIICFAALSDGQFENKKTFRLNVIPFYWMIPSWKYFYGKYKLLK